MIGRLRGPAIFDSLSAAAVGSLDFAPVDFSTLTRRWTPNDALVCPGRLCPNARPDFEPASFALPAGRLRALLAETALAEADTARIAFGQPVDQDRFVVRSRFLRAPDLVDMRIIDLGGGRSTPALYSRSLLGFADFGVNRARLKRWLAGIAERAGKP